MPSLAELVNGFEALRSNVRVHRAFQLLGFFAVGRSVCPGLCNGLIETVLCLCSTWLSEQPFCDFLAPSLTWERRGVGLEASTCCRGLCCGVMGPYYYITVPCLSLVPSFSEAVCILQAPFQFVFWEEGRQLPKR